MKLKAECRSYFLHFYSPAGTSRGELKTKPAFFLRLSRNDLPGVFGIGECGLLPGLSIETEETAAIMLGKICHDPDYYAENPVKRLKNVPSVLFAFECALLDLQHGGRQILFPSKFTDGKDDITFNALVWMADKKNMLRQIEQKINSHCRCIKIKIGALDFNSELDMIKHIRSLPSGGNVEIRLDANGAFKPKEALEKIERLAKFGIHSIEQPLKKGQHKALAELIRNSPVPIALDEELIGLHDYAEKKILLSKLKPQYLVLKPGLLGGFKASDDWIELCKKFGIGYWITSALESNIGLNAIAQWTYKNLTNMPQGLGTGKLYRNNFPCGIQTMPDYRIKFDIQKNADFLTNQMFTQQFEQTCYRFTSTGVEFKPDFQKQPEYWQQIESWTKNNTSPKYLRVFARTVKKWHSTRPGFVLRTSGSTGTPKPVTIKKKYALISAKHTLSALKIPNHSRILLCLSANYIAGLMVYVRAIVSRASLTVTPPETNVLEKINDTFDLVSLVPYQLSKVLKLTDYCRCILLGGGTVPNDLLKKIPLADTQIYETYGMTETISHIALKDLTAKHDWFKALPHVKIRADKESRICISAPEIGILELITNDLIKLTGTGTFIWLGRTDDVINVAGNKSFAPLIEQKIGGYLNRPFIVTAIAHHTLGEVPALVVEGNRSMLNEIRAVLKRIKPKLKSFETPKFILFTQKTIFDDKGKITRRKFSNNPRLFLSIE